MFRRKNRRKKQLRGGIQDVLAIFCRDLNYMGTKGPVRYQFYYDTDEYLETLSPTSPKNFNSGMCMIQREVFKLL